MVTLKAKKILWWIARNPMEIIAATALALSIFLTTINAVTRYAFSWVWNPLTDMNTLFFGYTVFCGSAAAYKRKMHYGIDIIVNSLPAKIKTAVDMLTHAIMLFGMGFAAYLAYDLTIKVSGKVLPNTDISYFWFDLSAFLGFGYMFIYELEHTIADVKKAFGKAKEEKV